MDFQESSVKLDELDIKILRELREDAKQSIRKIAEKVGSHPNTVLQRIKRLERNQVIVKYAAEIDFAKIGYFLHAYVFIRVRRGIVGDVEQLMSITKIPNIVELHAVTGSQDVIAVVRAKDRKELVSVLQDIQKHPIVVRTSSAIVLYSYKRSYEFNPL